MIPPSTLPPGYDIAELSGPEIISSLLDWGLFGTLTMQLYLYYQAFPNDRSFNKCLVYTVYLLELAQTILVTQDAFIKFGYGFGDVSTLTDIQMGWLSIPIMSALVALIGQSFYAYRVHVLSRSLLIPVLIIVVSIDGSVGGFMSGVYGFKARHNITLLKNQNTAWAAGLWLGGSALSDIMIAVCMTYYLSKNDTGFRQTHVLVSKLTRLTIETGSVTALVTLITLALFYVFPDKTYYSTPGSVIPKLYANTMFAVLNSRMEIVGGRGTYTSSSEMISIPSYLRNNVPSANSTRARPSPVVSFTREVFSDRELEDLVRMKGTPDSHTSTELPV
ncbi:hypothetical protein DFH09DRAFT_324494 [Mycena vulgaris]|nr:hypothetical protein DFH09DRAFT_324494 [Mycena vulgaris]